MRRRAEATDTSILSYLDVLCCGFGGAVFLFLVFAAAAGNEGTPRVEAQLAVSEPGVAHTVVIRWNIEQQDAMVRVQIAWPIDGQAGPEIGYCLTDDPSERCVRAASSAGEVSLAGGLEDVAMWLWSDRGIHGLQVVLSLTAPTRDWLEDTRVYLRCDTCPVGETPVSVWAGWTGASGDVERSGTLRTLERLAAWPPSAF